MNITWCLFSVIFSIMNAVIYVKLKARISTTTTTNKIDDKSIEHIWLT